MLFEKLKDKKNYTLLIPVANLTLGFALCCKVVSSLYQAYFGQAAIFLSRLEAWLVVHLVLRPLGYAASLESSVICLPGGKLNVIFECLAPEIFCFLIIMVWLLSTNWRELWQGLLLCPFFFLIMNTLRLGLLTVISVKNEKLFNLLHGSSFDFAMLIFAGFCLWLWVSSKQKHQTVSPTEKTRRWMWASLLIFNVVLFHLGALWFKEYMQAGYQKYIFALLEKILSVNDPRHPSPIGYLLNFTNVSVFLALIWMMPRVGWRVKLSASLGIFFLRVGFDVYLCFKYIAERHIQNSNAIEPFGNNSRIFFQIVSGAITVFLAVISWRVKRACESKLKEPKQNAEEATEPKDKSSQEQVSPAQKATPIPMAFRFMPEMWLIALTPFVAGEFLNIEEALWLNLYILTGWLVLSIILQRFNWKIRVAGAAVLTAASIFTCDLPVNGQAYEIRAYSYILPRRYRKALPSLNGAVKNAGQTRPVLYLERALCLIVTGDTHRAKADIEQAMKSGLCQEKASDCMDLLHHIGEAGPGIAEEIVRSSLLDLFSDQIPKQWLEGQESNEDSRRYTTKEMYDRNISAFPKSHILYWRRGFLNFLAKRWTDALNDFHQALSLSPSFYHCIYYSGMVYMKKSQPSKARQAFYQCIKLNKSDALAYYQIGESYRIEKDYRSAYNEYLKVISISPHNTGALKRLMFGMQEDPDDTVELK